MLLFHFMHGKQNLPVSNYVLFYYTDVLLSEWNPEAELF